MKNATQNYTSSYLSWQPPPPSLQENLIIEKIIIFSLIIFLLILFLVGIVLLLRDFIAKRNLRLIDRAGPASHRRGNSENHLTLIEEKIINSQAESNSIQFNFANEQATCLNA